MPATPAQLAASAQQLLRRIATHDDATAAAAALDVLGAELVRAMEDARARADAAVLMKELFA